MPSIPFEVAEKNGKAISGLLYLEEEFLVFDLPERKLGVFKRIPSEKVKVEVGLIDHLHLTGGWFSHSLYLVPKRSEILKAIPGEHKSEIKLKVAKRYKEQARELIENVLSTKRARSGV